MENRINSASVPHDRGGVPWRVILIQLVILAGLLTFFRFYLPHRERVQATQAVADREQKIEDFFKQAVVTDATHEIAVPLNGAVVKRHPQRLRTTLHVDEVEARLGAPDQSTTDFRGGEHLTWIGSTHKLEAAFNAGLLYCLSYEDRKTGQGVMVFESIWSWHPYSE